MNRFTLRTILLSTILIAPFIGVFAQTVEGYSVAETTQVMGGNFNLYSPAKVPGVNRYFLGGWGVDTRPNPLYDEIHRTENWGPITTVISKKASGKLVNDGTVVRTPDNTLIMYYSQIDQSIIEAGGRGELTNEQVFSSHEIAYSISTDNGLTWRDGGVLISPTQSGDQKGAWEPSALVVGDQVWIYYKTGSQNFSQPILFRQKLDSDGIGKIGSASRLSISDWGSQTVANPDVKLVGNTYILAGSDFRPGEIVLYHSANGLSFEPLIKTGTNSHTLIDGTTNGGYVTSPLIEVVDADSFYVYYAQGPDDNNDNLGNEFENVFRSTINLSISQPEVVGGSCTLRSLPNNAEKNLSGYAWSSTIGWLSMNCENTGTCESSDYGVSVYPNGDMGGYAWSSNIGWVSFFEEDLAGCPSGSCEAKINKNTGEVTGWARALAPMCGAHKAQSGNWDGWIYLGQSNRVGVEASACVWQGYAWGGGETLANSVIGWLSFKGPGYGVNGSGVACVGDGGGVDLTVNTITVSTQNNDSRTTFDIPIKNIGDEGVNGGIDVRLQIAINSDASSEFDNNYDVDDIIINLNAGQEKIGKHTLTNLPLGKHKVRACVDHNNEIAEDNEGNNCGPETEFQLGDPTGGITVSCSPDDTSVSVGDVVTWTATVNGNTGNTTFVWEGTDGLSGTTNPIDKTYNTQGQKSAKVTVTAANGVKEQNCSVQVTVGGGPGNTPTASLTADPDEVLFGNGTTLEWSSTNANSCTGRGFNTGGATSGSVTVTPSNDATYQLTCVRGSREAIAYEDVDVLFPEISITADGIEGQTRVSLNEVIEIAWVANDVEECNITGPGINLTGQTGDPVEGTQDVTISQRSTYTLECFVQGSPFTESVVVNIPPDFEEF